MARTEIYIIRKDKTIDCRPFASIPCDFQGAWHIWEQIEQKYLPSVPLTKENMHFFLSYGPDEYRSRLALSFLSALHPEQKNPMYEVWSLSYAKETEWNDRILLEMNNDLAYIAYDDLHEVAEALRNSDFASDNMKGQADALDRIHNENIGGEVFGVWINATSVNCAEDFMDCTRDENGEIIERRLHPEAYDIMEFLRKIKELDWNMDAYVEWCNSQKEE